MKDTMKIIEAVGVMKDYGELEIYEARFDKPDDHHVNFGRPIRISSFYHRYAAYTWGPCRLMLCCNAKQQSLNSVVVITQGRSMHFGGMKTIAEGSFEELWPLLVAHAELM